MVQKSVKDDISILQFFIGIVLILIFAAEPLFVSAEPLTIAWTIATQRTDGTPYLSSDRGGTKIKYWLSGKPGVIKDVKSPSATTLTVDVPPGTYTVQGMHYDTAGRQGPYGLRISKVVAPKTVAPPKPPSNVK